MPYAHRKIIYDADTHMMERADWIAEFADSSIKNSLEPFVGGKKKVDRHAKTNHGGAKSTEGYRGS